MEKVKQNEMAACRWKAYLEIEADDCLNGASSAQLRTAPPYYRLYATYSVPLANRLFVYAYRKRRRARMVVFPRCRGSNEHFRALVLEGYI